MKTSFHSMFEFKKTYNTDEYLNKNLNSASISVITTPNEVFELSTKWKDTLRLIFADTDSVVHPKVFTREQANQILDFLVNNKNRDEIIIHCYMGISRSAAIALFIEEFINHNIIEDIMRSPYRGYNRHVYTTLVRAYNSLDDNND